MIYAPAPLETLASYAIAFVAGALSVMTVSAYGRWVRDVERQINIAN